MKPLRGSPHRALLLMLGLVFLLSVAVVLYCVQSYWQADIAYEALQEALPAQNVFSAPETSLDTHAPQLPSPIMTPLPASVLQTLKMQNEHFTFHLSCPDTAINYPVVQGEDNAYYLGHLFGGEENAAGCLFVDYLCDQDFSSDNTIVYGHSMKNGSMFATLLAYKDETFYKAHPTMQLQTADAVYLIELIAGYSPADDFDAWQIDFANDDAFYAFLDEAQAASTFQSDITVTAQDSLITLSTCSYETADARYVVLGRLVPAAS